MALQHHWTQRDFQIMAELTAGIINKEIDQDHPISDVQILAMVLETCKDHSVRRLDNNEPRFDEQKFMNEIVRLTKNRLVFNVS